MKKSPHPKQQSTKNNHKVRCKTIFFIGILILLWIAFWWGWNMFYMPNQSYQNQLAKLNLSQKQLKQALIQHVDELANHIGPRNIFHYAALNKAADYISNQFVKSGYLVKEDTYTFRGKKFRNLELEIPGKTDKQDIILLGAHYDTVKNSPGADDNASGVAGLIEIAKLLTKNHYARTIRIVAFTNEELPFFKTKWMGSYVYAQKARAQNEKILAMISLDGIGYYSDKKNSQSYPWGLQIIYPSVGNFIGFVANLNSVAVVRYAINSFRKHAQIPSQGAALPQFFPYVTNSDQWSFWQAGYCAVMITDTLPLRNPHYHLATDTPTTINFDAMTLAVEGISKLISDMAVTQ